MGNGNRTGGNDAVDHQRAIADGGHPSVAAGAIESPEAWTQYIDIDRISRILGDGAIHFARTRPLQPKVPSAATRYDSAVIDQIAAIAFKRQEVATPGN